MNVSTTKFNYDKLPILFSGKKKYFFVPCQLNLYIIWKNLI